MPKYKTHLFGGFITFASIIIIINLVVNCSMSKAFTFNTLKISFVQALLYLACCLVGSIFPDIDTKSKAQKLLYYPLFMVLACTILLKKWILSSCLSFIALIPVLANHRHLTHKVWFVVTIPLAIPITIYICSNNPQLLKTTFICYIFFVSGAISHLILDFGPRRFLSKKR